MSKDHLLGLYRTKLNHIQLTYASLVLWSYPDTPRFFDELHLEMNGFPKPFPNLRALLNDETAMRKGLPVSNGEMAANSWLRMHQESDEGQFEELRKQLLEYCHLDTLAMVRILEKMREMVSN